MSRATLTTVKKKKNRVCLEPVAISMRGASPGSEPPTPRAGSLKQVKPGHVFVVFGGFSPSWTRVRGEAKDPRRRDRKHHVTAAVIASETTKRVKPPPTPRLYRLLLLPGGVITQFAPRKWNHSESSTFRWAHAPPPLLPVISLPVVLQVETSDRTSADPTVRKVFFISAVKS